MSSRQGLEMELARLTERYEEQPAGRVFAPLADCHRKLGQLDTALQVCLTGLARHPDYSSAQLILGKIFLDRGEDDPAKEALQRVLDLDGQNLLAMRLLAEMAERLGELDEAEVRWRQLAACEYDPELTDERLESIAAQRRADRQRMREPELRAQAQPEPHPVVAEAPVAREVAPEPAPQPVTESLSEAVTKPVAKLVQEDPALAPDSVFEVVRVPEPAAAPDFSKLDLPAAGGRTSEIATLTLAGIYAEQGFKTKALEIYRAIAARNPGVPGLQEKIATIESAMARTQEQVVQEMGAGPDEKDPGRQSGLQVVASSNTRSEESDSRRPMPSEPLFSDLPGAPDPVGNDASRYRRFGTWLDRVKSDDED